MECLASKTRAALKMGISHSEAAMVYSLQSSPVFLFFFQAEDGIRDLVRSRGLGDVYKSQERSRCVLRGLAQNTAGVA